jgi:hypothetical protein
MRKALIPMLASLALCGAGTLALIASNEHAQASPHAPMMVTLTDSALLLTQNISDTSADQDGQATPLDSDFGRICDERYASEAGRMAYLEVRLALTETEQPLFAQWKNMRLAIARRSAADCRAHGPSGEKDHANPLDRMDREEDRLKQHIADLDAERPVFAAFYTALTPAQQDLLAPYPRREASRRPSQPRRAPMGNFPPPSL